jgi:7,8-dihydropterin-6-yl-methyl-4-(beta-D-ribofuranosyl)aminobenzene 5'-phosphate synthase
MRVLVLSDNRAGKMDFEIEHGLSVYLEAESYKCLLDAGASGLFARNANLLNIGMTFMSDRIILYLFLNIVLIIL